MLCSRDVKERFNPYLSTTGKKRNTREQHAHANFYRPWCHVWGDDSLRRSGLLTPKVVIMFILRLTVRGSHHATGVHSWLFPRSSNSQSLRLRTFPYFGPSWRGRSSALVSRSDAGQLSQGRVSRPIFRPPPIDEADRRDSRQAYEPQEFPHFGFCFAHWPTSPARRLAVFIR